MTGNPPGPAPGDAAAPRGMGTFLVLWLSQSASVVGTQITFFAVNVWLAQVMYPLDADRPRLAAAISANALAYALPTVLGTPPAGVWADRHDRRRMMIAGNLAACALSAVAAALLVTGRMTLPWLLALTAGAAFAATCHQAALDASVSSLVPAGQLPRANGMLGTTYAIAAVLAPPIGALLLAVPRGVAALPAPGPLAPLAALPHGAGLAVAADAATFALAALALAGLAVPSPRRDAADRASMWQDLVAGGRFLGRHRPLLWLLGLGAAANFAFALFTVGLPLLVRFELAPSWEARGMTFETALAWVLTIGGLGGVLGGVVVSAWGGLRRRRAAGVVAPILVLGLTAAAVGLSRSLALTAGLLAVLEAMVPFANAHGYALWQSLTPSALQGRVLGVRRVVGQCTYPLGTTVAGGLTAALGAGPMLSLSGALVAAFGITQLFNRPLMRVDEDLTPAP